MSWGGEPSTISLIGGEVDANRPTGKVYLRKTGGP